MRFENEMIRSNKNIIKFPDQQTSPLYLQANARYAHIK